VNDSPNITDSLATAGIRCYEIFRDGSIAFEWEGELCFGPSEKVFAALSGSNESFLTGEAAEARIAELRKRAGDRSFRSTPPVCADNDGLATTRKRWEAERGQWAVDISRTSASSSSEL
jgi:hypothetical protein